MKSVTQVLHIMRQDNSSNILSSNIFVRYTVFQKMSIHDASYHQNRSTKAGRTLRKHAITASTTCRLRKRDR